MQYIPLDHIRAYSGLEHGSLYFENDEGEADLYDQAARRFVGAHDLPARRNNDWYRADDGTAHALIEGFYGIDGCFLDDWEENADAALAVIGLKLGPVADYSTRYAFNRYHLEPID